MKHTTSTQLRRALLALLLTAAVGCSDASRPTDPFAPDLARVANPEAFTVYTHNVYLGGDTGPIFAIDFSNLPALVAATNVAWAEILASDIPERVTAVVDELTLDLTKKIGCTAVIVTHDMNSVFRIATRIIMLGTGDGQGHIVAQGTPEEIRNNPDPAVQHFINGEAGGATYDEASTNLYRGALLD